MRRWYLIVAMIAGSVMADWTIDPRGLPTGDFIAIRVDTICDTFVGGGIGDCVYDTMVWADGAWRELSPPDTLMRGGGQRFAKKPVPTTLNLFPDQFPFVVHVVDRKTGLGVQTVVWCYKPTAQIFMTTNVLCSQITDNGGRAFFSLERSKFGYGFIAQTGESIRMSSPGEDTIWINELRAASDTSQRR